LSGETGQHAEPLHQEQKYTGHHSGISSGLERSDSFASGFKGEADLRAEPPASGAETLWPHFRNFRRVGAKRQKY